MPPGIFDEVDDEPVAEDRNALIEFHVQFDGEFDRLVYDEQQDDEQGETSCSWMVCSAWYVSFSE